MKKYIGTKIVNAKPMNRADYNKFRGWEPPSAEDGTDEGYLVEYTDGGQANHPDYAGYVSWSPFGVFDRSYREAGSMTFGQAIESMRMGRKLARKGWNGRGMYVVIMPGYPEGIEANEATRKAHNLQEGDKLRFLPYFQMYTATGDVTMWMISPTDALSEDWYIV